MTINEEKIKQVTSAINENGIDAFDDMSLAKLLSILTPNELDYFEENSYKYLSNYLRISKVRPLVNYIINNNLNNIRNSEVYQNYIKSLKDNTYLEYIKSLDTKDLFDLKKYIRNTISKKNESVANKIINIISQEIKYKEQNKKPCFE